VSQSVIEVQQLSKKFRIATERRDSLKERFVRGKGKYDEFWALRDVDCSIGSGTTFGFVGHNGSGKSTLLKMLAGIYRPTSGSLAVNGRVSALLELGAGFHPELTGRENVYLNGAILGLSRKRLDSAMDHIISFAGLEEFIDAPVKVYSSGMYVRLGFSVAVTVDPEILLVDEIIAVGDEAFQRKCFDHLYELRRRGTTIVLVSHALGLMTELCDNGLWLEKGRTRAYGPIREVVDGYLESVNEQEAEEHAAEGGSDEVNDSGRTGSGEIRVTELEFLDHDGNSPGFLMSGEPCTIRLHYHATRALPSVTFGLGLVHESGPTVAAPHSGHGDAAMAVPAGTGYLDFDVDELLLQPGVFLVSTSAADRGHVYDARDRAFELRVRARGAESESGLIRLPGHWRGVESNSVLPFVASGKS
jgi:ABC-2 type transport system ATP-binding protein/lipopolysaccharide transport system ATP-binding protein